MSVQEEGEEEEEEVEEEAVGRSLHARRPTYNLNYCHFHRPNYLHYHLAPPSPPPSSAFTTTNTATPSTTSPSSRTKVQTAGLRDGGGGGGWDSAEGGRGHGSKASKASNGSGSEVTTAAHLKRVRLGGWGVRVMGRGRQTAQVCMAVTFLPRLRRPGGPPLKYGR